MRGWIRNFKIVLALVAAVASNPNFAAEIEALTTQGGLPFLHIQDDQYENVVMQVYWPSTWSFQNALNPMVPLVSTQVVFTGSAEGVEDNTIGQRLEELQAQRSLIPTAESVTGALVTPADNFEEVAQLVNRVLANPAFDPDLTGRLKQFLSNRMNQLRQGPEATAGELARNLLMQDSPVRGFFSSAAESESFIEAATLDELKQFYFATVTRSSPTIVMASPFTSERAGNALDVLVDGLPEGEIAESPASAFNFSAGATVVLHDPEVERSYLLVAGSLPPVSQGGDDRPKINRVARPVFTVLPGTVGALLEQGQPEGTLPLFDGVGDTDLKGGVLAGVTFLVAGGDKASHSTAAVHMHSERLGGPHRDIYSIL